MAKLDRPPCFAVTYALKGDGRGSANMARRRNLTWIARLIGAVPVTALVMPAACAGGKSLDIAAAFR